MKLKTNFANYIYHIERFLYLNINIKIEFQTNLIPFIQNL